MPTYITLVEYTEEGIQNMDQSPERLQAAREVCMNHGGELNEFYLTMGEYDAVTVSTFPDDAAAAKAMLTIAKSGAVRTKTLQAFPENEYHDICADL